MHCPNSKNANTTNSTVVTCLINHHKTFKFCIPGLSTQKFPCIFWYCDTKLVCQPHSPFTLGLLGLLLLLFGLGPKGFIFLCRIGWYLVVWWWSGYGTPDIHSN